MALPAYLQSIPAGKELLPREVMAEHQRQRVIDAAIEVFAKRGYPPTTVDHIVDAAKTGVGSFYNLFEGKEDCFLRGYEQVVADGRARIIAALPPDGDWGHQLVSLLRALLELIAAEPLRARLALVEVQTAGPEALRRYESTLEEAAELLGRGRAENPQAVALPASLDFAIVGGLVWFLQQRIVLGEADKPKKLLPQALEIVAEPYLGKAATAELLASS